MKIEVLDDDLTKRVYDVSEFEKIEEDIVYVDSSSKENSIIEFFKAYLGDKKSVLFDNTNKTINDFLQSNEELNLKNIDFSVLLFTSGTSGKPVGAFKSKDNLELEVKVLSSLLSIYNPQKVISTVPFIHIYGILTSVLLPYRLGVDLLFKEHFLPYNLLSCIEPNSIVVTTPLYIKSLLRINETKTLKDVVFISSTGPLDAETAKEFIEKFDTNLFQLFGSTETGGMAYKKQFDEFWTPLPSIHVKSDENGLLAVESDFISPLLYDGSFKKTLGRIQSFDYVEFDKNRFKIIGRSSQIFKVGGKRFSTLHVEEILEKSEFIKKVFVSIEYKKGELKDEVLHIFVEESEGFEKRKIQEILNENFGKIKFPIKVTVVEKIPTTAMGKKIMPVF